MHLAALVVLLVSQVKVPAEHPRVLFTAADLPALRERITSEPFARAWETVRASAAQLDRVDPKNVIGSLGLQAGSHAFAEILTTAAFEALVSEDADARSRFNAFVEALDVKGIEAQLPAGEFMPHGEFLYGPAVAYDWAHPYLSDANRRKLADIVRRRAAAIYAAFVAKATWEASIDANNHSMACIAPVGLAGLALWGEEKDAKEWVAMASKKVVAYVDQSFDEDGGGIEGNLYGTFGLDMALPFAAAVRKLGGGDLIAESRLRGAIKWIATDALPDGRRLNLLNDSGGNATFGNVPLFAAATYKDGLGRWLDANKRQGSVVRSWPSLRVVWDANVVEAAPPGPELFVRRHRGRGLVNVRTGFDAEAIFASFECGLRRNGAHCQADQGQFTLFAGEAEFAIDTGYNNEPKEGSANQSVGHNLVLIDGKGQAISGGGQFVEGRTTAYVADEMIVAAVGDLAPAYNARDYNPVTAAWRVFVWVRTSGKPYLIVADSIAKAGTHRYESLLHTGSGNEVAWKGGEATITARGRSLRVRYATAAKLKTETRTMKFDRATVGEHPVLAASADGPSWLCATVLTFDDAEVKSESRGASLTVRVKRADGEDVFSFQPGPKLAFTRSSAGKKVYEKKW